MTTFIEPPPIATVRVARNAPDAVLVRQMAKLQSLAQVTIWLSGCALVAALAAAVMVGVFEYRYQRMMYGLQRMSSPETQQRIHASLEKASSGMEPRDETMAG